jgi:transposase
MQRDDARRLSPEAQQVLRMRTVKAVASGMSQVEAARVFGVTRQAVGKWMRAHAAGGVRALKAQRRGRPKGSGGRLKPWQAAHTAKLLTDRTPDQLKLPFYLWTRVAVAELIERKFGIRLSLSSVGRYLARWGFTPQKPVRRAFERDPQAIARWLKEQYPALRARAKREGAQIYWGDEMGMRSDHSAGTSYGRRGHTPVIAGTGKRFRCNLISAITNRGQLNFMVFKERFDTPVLLRFVRRLLKQAGSKVFLIVDGHPVHRAKEVARWVEARTERIALFFLPGYAPELNPDELLNQDVKTNAVGKQRPHDQRQLMHNVRAHLHRRQRQSHLVRRFFEQEHVRYAAA